MHIPYNHGVVSFTVSFTISKISYIACLSIFKLTSFCFAALHTQLHKAFSQLPKVHLGMLLNSFEEYLLSICWLFLYILSNSFIKSTVYFCLQNYFQA